MAILKTDFDRQRRYAIESGIPIAPHKTAMNKYPFATMEIGQSFKLESNLADEVQRVQAACQHWRRTHAPMKFAVRMDPQRNYRCWRIA